MLTVIMFSQEKYSVPVCLGFVLKLALRKLHVHN